MLTLKFYRETGKTVISCMSYDTHTNGDGPEFPVLVGTYPTMTKENGVERSVGNHDGMFSICYVENIAGKTIDVIRPNK